MIKINFVSYLSPFVKGKIGGGEYITRNIITSAEKYEVDIRFAFREDGNIFYRFFRPSMTSLHMKPDLWILCDIYNIPRHRLSFRKGFIENIVLGERYIHFDNAYVDICSRDALPCSNDLNLCSKCFNSEERSMLYNNSLANFFLSPMHADEINKRFFNRYSDKTFIVPPFLDSRQFYNKNLERDIKYLYVGTIADYKGYQNIKNKYEHVGDDFYFIGKKSRKLSLFSRNYYDYMPIENLVNFYNRAETFVHLPNWKEPMARTVIEAAVCGCKLDLNNNVGAASFDFDLYDSSNYSNSEGIFWNKIKSYL